jgi:hypothetical protein
VVVQAADGNDLLPRPDLQPEGAAAAVDDGVGAVIQQLERRHGAAAADPDQSGREELGRLKLELELCLGRETAGASKVFLKFL